MDVLLAVPEPKDTLSDWKWRARQATTFTLPAFLERTQNWIRDPISEAKKQAGEKRLITFISLDFALFHFFHLYLMIDLRVNENILFKRTFIRGIFCAHLELVATVNTLNFGCEWGISGECLLAFRLSSALFFSSMRIREEFGQEWAVKMSNIRWEREKNVPTSSCCDSNVTL